MKDLKFALVQIVPVLFSYVFVGIAFGILMTEAGYSFWWSVFAATFVYAGSMQLVLVSLLVSGIPLYMMAILTLFINGRHIFYGIGFIDKFKHMGLLYPYMAVALTDETYSVLCSVKYPEDINPKRVDFMVLSFSHLSWIISCTIGAVVGNFIPFDMTGIDFTATAFFVTVCVNKWREIPSHIPTYTGIISGILFYFIVGPDNFILPALSVSLITLVILKDKVMLKAGGNDGN